MPDSASLERLFELTQRLVRTHSPSGREEEIDAVLLEEFAARGVAAHADACGNIVGHVPGRAQGRLAITAHKDEIGAIVTQMLDDGRVKVRRLGGSYPWIYGEGPVELIGDEALVPGILSFGSRHVSHASPQHAHLEKAPVQWSDAWVETKRGRAALEEAGIRPGSRLVVARGRKMALRLGDHIASYTLDNKASLAVLLELASRLDNPGPEIFLVASTKEEIGASGGMFFARENALDAMIALEIAPLSQEYDIKDTDEPVLLAEDNFTVYHDALNAALRTAGSEAGVAMQTAMVSAFGSDASFALRSGLVPRAACLGFPTQNTHGFEIAPLGAIANCVSALEAFCKGDALAVLLKR